MVEIDNNTEIEIDLSGYSEETREMVVYRIPFLSKKIKSFRVEGSSVFLVTDVSERYGINKMAMEMINETDAASGKEKQSVIFENTAKSAMKKDDIFPQLLEKKWIIHYDDGLIGFGKGFLDTFKRFDNVFLDWSRDLGATEYVYPDLIDIATLNKCKYIEQFPNNILFSSHVQEDMEKIKRFSEMTSEGKNCLNDLFLEHPTYANKSAICMHTYKQYENSSIDLKHPVIITSVGKCKRYESLNMKKVERLFDFTMREIVLIGSEAFVLNKREELMNRMKVLIKEMDITASIKTSSDPFFLSQYQSKAALQQRFKLKYEMNMYLPYAEKELAVASFNYHGTYFTDAFHIQAKDGGKVYTGCIAFGLERFAYAYLCQRGLC